MMGERGKLSCVLAGELVGLGEIGGWRYWSLILASQVVDFDHELVFFFHVAHCSEHFWYFSFCLTQFLVQWALDFTKLIETTALDAHLFELLHDVDVVGDEDGPEAFGDGLIPVDGGAVPDSLLALHNIVLDDLDLFEAFFLVEIL